MAKPVTNAEVEDVLSSVRRLVSEGKRPNDGVQADAGPPSNDTPKAKDPGQERLVLTPDFRVPAADARKLKVEIKSETGTKQFKGVGLDDAALMADLEAFLTEAVAPAPQKETKSAEGHAPDGSSQSGESPSASATSPVKKKGRPPAKTNAVTDKIAALENAVDNLDPGKETKAAPPPQETEEELIDEEALRELIAEVVRAELQGAVGERITRNLRELVKREIDLALKEKPKPKKK